MVLIVKIVLLMSVGIIMGSYTHQFPFWMCLLGLFALWPLVKRFPVFSTCIIQLCLIVMGAILGQQSPSGTCKICSSKTLNVFEVLEVKEKAEGAHRATLKRLGCQLHKVWVYSYINFEIGDRVKINKPLQSIANNDLPFAFDYVNFALKHQVENQLFLNEIDFNKIEHRNTFRSWTFSFRDRLEKKINANLKPRAASVLCALLLGNRAHLSEDTIRLFRDTGTMHILAVSGMHIGILSGLLFFLFKPIRNYPILRFALLIGLIWIFTFITGAGPPAVRASVMATFFFTGSLIKKRIGGLHGLFIALFCILCIEPSQLFHLSFQLSAAAVLGIILFYKKILSLIDFRNKLLKYSWNITAIGLSAQVGIIPFMLIYFNQFPVYFILTGIFAAPLAACIMACGITTLTLSFISLLSTSKIWIIVDAPINFLLEFLEAVLELPMPLISNLNINSWELIIVLLIPISALLSKVVSQRKIILIQGLLLLFLLISHLWNVHLEQDQITCIGYQHNSAFIVQAIYGSNAIIFHRGKQPPKPFLFRGANKAHRVLKTHFVSLKNDFNMTMEFQGESQNIHFKDGVLAFENGPNFTLDGALNRDVIRLKERSAIIYLD